MRKPIVYLAISLCAIALLLVSVHLAQRRERGLPRGLTQGAPAGQAAAVNRYAMSRAAHAGSRAGEATGAPSGSLAPIVVHRPIASQPPSERIRRVVDGRVAYRDRLIAIRALGGDLDEDEANALFGFLRLRADTQSPLDPLALNALKNDLVDAMIKAHPMPVNLGAELIAMFRDEQLDVVWRDYCVQHFAPYYEEKWPPGTPVGDDDAGRQEMLIAFGEALSETGSTLAGTALIGLERLSASYGEVSRAWVISNAMAIATSEEADAAARLTALQVCSHANATAVLPTVRILAQTGEVVPLRLSAVATLGALGKAEDTELLQSLSFDADRRVAKAAGKALVKLQTANSDVRSSR